MRQTKCICVLLLALLLLVTLLPGGVLANESTTTGHYAAKDLGANTEIYAVMDTAGSDYPDRKSVV